MTPGLQGFTGQFQDPETTIGGMTLTHGVLLRLPRLILLGSQQDDKILDRMIWRMLLHIVPIFNSGFADTAPPRLRTMLDDERLLVAREISRIHRVKKPEPVEQGTSEY